MPAAAVSSSTPRLLGVSISDVAKYPQKGFNNSLYKQMDEAINGRLDSLFEGIRVDLVHGFFVQSEPQWIANNSLVKLKTLAVIRGEGGSDEQRPMYLMMVEFLFNPERGSISVKTLKIYDRRSLNLSIQVALVDRKVILTEANENLKIVMPVGVGAVDEGVLNPGKVSLLTPRFKQAFITKSTTESHRDRPTYFQGKPFITIVDGVSGKASAIGFHTEINDSFLRGFDSHGCMRLRDQDLFLVHDLVKSVQAKIPLTISYRVEDPTDHPAPKVDKTYKRVLNIGGSSQPQVALDRDDLVQLVYAKQLAPMDKMQDEALDHFTNLYQYEGMGTYQKQRLAQRAQCAAMFTNADDVESCSKKGERNLGLGDYLYRWWVH